MKERNRIMRIGRTVIDLETLSIEDLTAVISEARAVRARKQEAECLLKRMNELLNDAKEAGFDFIDKDFGNVLTDHDFEMYDNQ